MFSVGLALSPSAAIPVNSFEKRSAPTNLLSAEAQRTEPKYKN
jgi:hypothetical protein